jgi:hypothetical protein
VLRTAAARRLLLRRERQHPRAVSEVACAGLAAGDLQVG